MTNERMALELSHLNRVPDEEDRYYCPVQCKIFDAVLEACEMKDNFIKENLRLIIDIVESGMLRNDPYEVTINELKELFNIK